MKKMKAIKTIASGAILAAGLMLYTPEASAAKNFTDISSSASHQSAVKYMNSQDAFDYKIGNKLNGNNGVTRAEVSKILHTLYADELGEKRVYKNNFKDVNSKTKFSKEMIWSYEVGIFDGDGVNFNPTQTLTRGQMAKILVQAFDLEGTKEVVYSDVKKTNWAFPYVSILGSTGVTVGNGKGQYMPANKVTLNQLSSFIHRIVLMKEKSKDEEVTPTPEEKPKQEIDLTGVKNFEQTLDVIVSMYNSPEYKPENITITTKGNYEDQYWELTKGDGLSEYVEGYTWYGRTVEYYVEQASDGTYEMLLWVVDDRSEEEYYDWQNRLDKMEKYIVDNYALDTDYDVVYAVNNFVAGQIIYGNTISSNHEFMVHRGNASTCTGYTDVSSELFKRFGIETKYGVGDVHSWNLVKLDGKWYATDSTWNSTTSSMSYTVMTQQERASSGIRSFDNDFRATDVPWDMSMASPYSYEESKNRFR